jgi:hypothetical protein
MRHHESADPAISAAPVTDRLQAMDPLREFVHALRRLLLGVPLDPVAQLIASIRERVPLDDVPDADARTAR